MQLSPVLIFVLFGVLVVAGIAFSTWHAKKRREGFATVGAALGLGFDPAKDPAHAFFLGNPGLAELAGRRQRRHTAGMARADDRR